MAVRSLCEGRREIVPVRSAAADNRGKPSGLHVSWEAASVHGLPGSHSTQQQQCLSNGEQAVQSKQKSSLCVTAPEMP